MLTRAQLKNGPEGLLTDSPLTCGLRLKGFVEHITDRRQMTQAAHRLGPKDEKNVDGGLPLPNCKETV